VWLEGKIFMAETAWDKSFRISRTLPVGERPEESEASSLKEDGL
jgi:hypothetical protein